MKLWIIFTIKSIAALAQYNTICVRFLETRIYTRNCICEIKSSVKICAICVSFFITDLHKKPRICEIKNICEICVIGVRFRITHGCNLCAINMVSTTPVAVLCRCGANYIHKRLCTWDYFLSGALRERGQPFDSLITARPPSLVSL